MPGWYIVHGNNYIRLEKNDDSQKFKSAASWLPTKVQKIKAQEAKLLPVYRLFKESNKDMFLTTSKDRIFTYTSLGYSEENVGDTGSNILGYVYNIYHDPNTSQIFEYEEGDIHLFSVGS